MSSREDKIAQIKRLQKIEEIKKLRERPEELPSSPLASAAYGAGQGATFGLFDEGIGALKAGVKSLVDPRGNLLEDYRNARDQEREKIARSQKDNPITYGAGNVGGAMLSNLIPGVGIARGTGLGMATAKAALQGGLSGFGESTAQNPDDLQSDVAKGAGTAGILQGAVFGPLGKIAGALSPAALKGFAERRAAKAATGQNVAALRKAAGVNPRGGNLQEAEAKIQQMGRNILDEGLMDSFDSVRELSPKLGQAREKYGKQIGDIGTTIDQTAPNSVSGKAMADKLMQYASEIAPSGPGKRLQDALMSEAQILEGRGMMGFEDAQKFKNTFKFNPTDPGAVLSNQDVVNKVRGVIGESQEEAAAALANRPGMENLLKDYLEAKKKYGSFAGAESAATGRAISDLSNRFISPSDYAVGATAAATGALSGDPSALKTVAAAAANKIDRERGSSTAALTADSIAKLLDRSPAFAKEFGQVVVDAMQRGPAALTATHHILMKDPNYRVQFEGAEQ